MPAFFDASVSLKACVSGRFSKFVCMPALASVSATAQCASLYVLHASVTCRLCTLRYVCIYTGFIYILFSVS